MTARCDLTDLLTDQCAHCQGHEDPEREAARERRRLLNSGRGWFAALHPGTCDYCGEPFRPGTAIRMDIWRGWQAECCADQP